MDPGETLSDRYTIVRSLGEGGMGEVFLARDAPLERLVAIKLLSRDRTNDPSAREQLRREALAAAALDHPFICKVHDFGECGDLVFIVMEYVPGQTLRHRLEAGPLPVEEALHFVGELSEALQLAHAKLIVHRDVKPANVMLTAHGHVKLMDFGVARPIVVDVPRTSTDATTLTDRGSRVGTLAYMSPEQIMGDSLDGRSDIFSLGILLCEALTGVRPFQRDTAHATMMAILHDQPEIDATTLTAALARAVRHMLVKAPSQRYQSMTDVGADLAMVRGAAPSPGSSSPPETTITGPQPRSRWALVGRDVELAILQERLDAALAGRGALVLIGGEPGIGKTRLTKEVLEHAQHRGCVCLVGHCYDMEGTPPYTPFVETLEHAARLAPLTALRRALGDAAPELARLMPELRRLFPDLPPAMSLPAEQQRRVLFNAYREFVERSCRASPMVVVLEDLQWADGSTLQLLQHVSQGIASLPLLMLGTHRDLEFDGTRALVSSFAELLRQRLVSPLTLRPLSVAGVEQMLRAMSGQPPPASLARDIFAQTDGNPFFIEEIFRHLAEEGRLLDAKGGWRVDLHLETRHVPEGVRLVLLRRLERLNAGTRRVLTTAAVIGRSFDVRLLEALEDGPGDTVLEALEEAERAFLVVARVQGRQTRYAFAHELIRQTLAGTLSVPRRERQHALVASAIERVFTDDRVKHVPALAHHLFEAGAAADPDKTAAYLAMAADQARDAAAHEQELTCVEHALALWEGERSPRVAECTERRGRVLRSLGRSTEAIEAFRAALRMSEELNDRVRLGSAGFALVLMLQWRAQFEAAIDVTQRVLDRMETSASVERARLLFWQAAGFSHFGDPEAAFRSLDEARRLQQSLGGSALDIDSATVETHMRWNLMQFDQALACSQEAIQLCRTRGDPWGEAAVEWVVPAAAIFHQGRLAEAPGLIEQAEARARRVGHHGSLWVLQTLTTVLTASRGDLDAAERAALASIELGRAAQSGWFFLSYVPAAELAVYRGQASDARFLLDAAVSAEPATCWGGVCRVARFWVRAQEHDPDAVALLHAQPPRLPAAGAANTIGAWVALVFVVEGLARLRQREEAGRLHPLTEDLVSAGGVFFGTHLHRTTAGIAATCAREWTRAEEHFRAAIAQADSLPVRLAQPHARIGYADMLLERRDPGDASRALPLLTAAVAMYDALGMPTFARGAQQQLDALSSGN